jgi:hypothetical protein
MNIPEAVLAVAKYRGGGPVRAEQLAGMAELLALIAQEQAESAAKMDCQTQTLIRLTWGLFWLTLALSFVAAVQVYLLLQPG